MARAPAHQPIVHTDRPLRQMECRCPHISCPDIDAARVAFPGPGLKSRLRSVFARGLTTAAAAPGSLEGARSATPSARG